MELHNLNQELDNINLDKPTKNAILQLIDLKTTSDMDKVLNRMDSIKTEMQNSSSILRTEMQGFNNRMEIISDALKIEMQAEMKSFNKEMKVMYWVIGAGMGILTIVMTILTIVISIKK